MSNRRATALNDKALESFLAAKRRIDDMLARIQTFGDDHFDTDPDAINWGDVGTLNHYSSLLRQITDIAFSEGECAKYSKPAPIRRRDGAACLRRRARIQPANELCSPYIGCQGRRLMRLERMHGSSYHQPEKSVVRNMRNHFAQRIVAPMICLSNPAMADTRQSVVTANGLTIAYVERGSATDEPILFVRSVGSTMEAGPDPIADQLVAAGFRWITFDNRDSGGSTHFKDAGMPDYEAIQRAAAEGRPLPLAYTLSDMADDAVGLLDTLEIDRAHIVGGSLGGVIAQVLAANHPDRVLSLTLISTTTGNPGLAWGPAVQ